MKKGYYIHFEQYDNSGVKKKIQSHIDYLRNYYSISEIVINNKRTNQWQKIIARLPFTIYGYDFKSLKHRFDDINFLYIRQSIFDIGLFKFLKNIKKINPNCKIILEIVTYPYTIDFFKRIPMWPLFLKDLINIRKASKYIDRIVTYSKHDSIFNVKTIKTINGIDLEKNTVINAEVFDNEIDLISVAVIRPHHGYERLIEGINNYYITGGKRKIKYHVVGNGFNGQLEYYNDLVKKYNLSDKIIFYGKRTGEELDEIFNKADIGVCSLGSYKIGVDASSQLKSREYLAKGLPMITGCYVDVLNDYNFPYYLQFENNNSPLNIDNIVQFYDNLQILDKREMTQNIRLFAEKHISMKIAFMDIIHFIDEG